MAKMSNKQKYLYYTFRVLVVSSFAGGFLFQTLEFMFLYWTYPTVVDIQDSSPTYLELPSFTFCNRIGYLAENICKKFSYNPCISTKLAPKVAAQLACGYLPILCDDDGKVPKDFKLIVFQNFAEKVLITQENIPLLARPLEGYLNCSIEFAGNVTKCNMENVMGSFYTTDDLPLFCFSLFSKWGNPDKEREKIPKGAIMKFEINTHPYINFTLNSEGEKEYMRPNYSTPTDAAVLIAVHSPYFLPSPVFEGKSYLAGRNYEMRIKLKESHLLPAPYQTNCTDYLTSWRQRGGKAPIHQLTFRYIPTKCLVNQKCLRANLLASVIQECRINKTYQAIGCIPKNLDYPHRYNICVSCSEFDKNCKWKEPPNECPLLAEDYNQPCDSMEYTVDSEQVAITTFVKAKTTFALQSDGIRRTVMEQNCSGLLLFGEECARIKIDVPFDRFTISNVTYNPKFESLEVFSVVGGYLGIWLGISLLTVFDWMVEGLQILRAHLNTKKRNRARKWKKVRHTEKQLKEDAQHRMIRNNYY